MTDKELMQLALYALGLAKSSHNMVLSSDPPQSAWRYYNVDRKLQETITALDKRLEQPEQEPVAWMTITDYGDEDDIWYENPEGHLLEGWTYKPLYTTPSQRPWVGLTEREVELIDGMIEVELQHAERCDRIANRNMAEKQKGWDMERVALLRKIKEKNT